MAWAPESYEPRSRRQWGPATVEAIDFRERLFETGRTSAGGGGADRARSRVGVGQAPFAPWDARRVGLTKN